MRIEKPDKSDYPELTEVWEASVRATHHFLKEEDVDFYCVRENYRIIGFMGLSADAIEMLFIHPDTRGKGVGKFLAGYAIREKGIDKVDVNEDNIQAIGFYEKLGFKAISRSPLDGMGKPYPLLHMALNYNA